jgi:hypothetical protein
MTEPFDRALYEHALRKARQHDGDAERQAMFYGDMADLYREFAGMADRTTTELDQERHDIALGWRDAALERLAERDARLAADALASPEVQDQVYGDERENGPRTLP